MNRPFHHKIERLFMAFPMRLNMTNFTITAKDNYCVLTRKLTDETTNSSQESLHMSWKNIMAFNEDPELGAELLKIPQCIKKSGALWSNPSDWARDTINRLNIPINCYYLPSNPAPWAIKELKQHKLKECHVQVLAKNTNGEVSKRVNNYLSTANPRSKYYRMVGYNLSRNPSEWAKHTLMEYPDLIDWRVLCHNPSQWAYELHKNNMSLIRLDLLISSNVPWVNDYMEEFHHILPTNPVLKEENFRYIHHAKYKAFINGEKFTWPIENIVKKYPKLGVVKYKPNVTSRRQV